MIKALILFFLIFFSWLQSQEFWYSYFFQDSHVGYTKIFYEWQEKEKNYFKKQEKYRKFPIEEREEISCVLSSDYSIRSGYISSQSNKEQDILVITVNDKILLQKKDKLITVQGDKIYLELNDFLKGIVTRSKLDYGRIYRSLVLSTDRMGACEAKARYLGKETLWINLEKRECHTFDVSTAELKNFWAKAQIDKDGSLLGYTLGTFQMLRVPKVYALEVEKSYPTMAAPFIFDIESVERMYLSYSNAPFPIPSGQNQRNKDGQIILRSPLVENPKITFRELESFSQEYIAPSLHIPSQSEFLREYAREIQGNSLDPVIISQRIAHWVQENLGKKRTLQGNRLALFLGFSRDLASIATISLCRAVKIPSRLVSGLVYAPGKWVYETWAEVFLGRWLPLYAGNIACGACFLSLVENKSYEPIKNLAAFPINVQKILKKGQTLSLDTPSSYFHIKEDKVTDKLLGISFTRPSDWVLLSKNLESDILILRSIKGNGPAILLKVFEMPRTLEEILENLSKKMGKEGNLEVLWQQPRAFSQGKAIEVALQSPQKLVYRGFLAESGKKGVAALLIVPLNELMLVEKGFQDFIFSLRFE